MSPQREGEHQKHLASHTFFQDENRSSPYIGAAGDVTPAGGDTPKAPGQPYIFLGREDEAGKGHHCAQHLQEGDENFGHPNALDGPRHLQPGFVGFTMVEEQGSFSCALL
jgi:hypothetical protein